MNLSRRAVVLARGCEVEDELHPKSLSLLEHLKAWWVGKSGWSNLEKRPLCLVAPLSRSVHENSHGRKELSAGMIPSASDT